MSDAMQDLEDQVPSGNEGSKVESTDMIAKGMLWNALPILDLH